MDETVMTYYRNLTKTGFEHSGLLDDPSISLENLGDFSTSCHGNTDDFMRIYINVVGNIISDIKYRCICDPAMNVAVEILCTLVKGKNLDDVFRLTEETFSQYLGSGDKVFKETAKGLLEFLKEGIARYNTQI